MATGGTGGVGSGSTTQPIQSGATSTPSSVSSSTGEGGGSGSGTEDLAGENLQESEKRWQQEWNASIQNPQVYASLSGRPAAQDAGLTTEHSGSGNTGVA